MRKGFVFDFVSVDGAVKMTVPLSKSATKHLDKVVKKASDVGVNHILVDKTLEFAPTKTQIAIFAGGLLLTGFMIGQSTQVVPEEKRDVPKEWNKKSWTEEAAEWLRK